MARSAPLACSTPSIFSAMAGSLTPTTCRRGRGRVGQRAEEVEHRRHAQLAAGRARRGAAAGWKRGAKQKPMPASSTQRGHPGRARGRWRRRGPRAGRPSRTADDAARLPCLHTRAPAPAATNAAMVETLMRVRCGRRRCRRCRGRRRPGGMATCSATVEHASAPGRSSPRPSRPSCAGRPMKAAIWAGVALPSRISARAAPACTVEVRTRPASAGRAPRASPASSR